MSRARVTSTNPLLIVSDLQRSIDFYTQKLGFTEPRAWGDPPCFAMMNRNGFDLMLSSENAGVHPNGPAGTWDVYVGVEDVAAEESALRAAGAEIVRGPEDKFYEMREIEVLDPDGYRWCFAQDIRSDRREQG